MAVKIIYQREREGGSAMKRDETDCGLQYI